GRLIFCGGALVFGVRQPLTRRPSATTPRAARRPARKFRCTVGVPSTVCSSVQLGNLDLLRPGSFDSGTVTILDKATHTQAAFLKRFRLKAGARKNAPMTFRYGDRERL